MQHPTRPRHEVPVSTEKHPFPRTLDRIPYADLNPGPSPATRALVGWRGGAAASPSPKSRTSDFRRIWLKPWKGAVEHAVVSREGGGPIMRTATPLWAGARGWLRAAAGNNSHPSDRTGWYLRGHGHADESGCMPARPVCDSRH